MPRHLALAGITAELHHNVANLTDAGCAYRMALRFQAAASIDGQTSIDGTAAGLSEFAALSFGNEAEVFARDNLRNGKAVVKFSDFNVVRSHAGHRVGFLASRFHCRKHRDVFLGVECDMI